MFRSWLRSCRKRSDILPLAALLSIVVILAGSLLSNLFLGMPWVADLIGSITRNDILSSFLNDYLSFIGIWIVVLIFILLIPANRPMLGAFGPNRTGNTGKGLLIGLLLGFGTNAFCILMSVLMGDIKLSWYGFEPVILLAFLIAVFIQSGAEELTDRLYLYQKLRRRYRSPLIAILGNAFVFTFLHIFNPGFTVVAGIQIFLIGVIFSMLVYYYDSLWAAITFHTAWNYTQNLIFGLPNSGIVSAYSVFRLEAASARSGLFYNVSFGVEGSTGACAVLLVCGIVLFIINRGKAECTDHWAAMEQSATDAGSLQTTCSSPDTGS